MVVLAHEFLGGKAAGCDAGAKATGYVLLLLQYLQLERSMGRDISPPSLKFGLIGSQS